MRPKNKANQMQFVLQEQGSLRLCVGKICVFDGLSGRNCSRYLGAQYNVLLQYIKLPRHENAITMHGNITILREKSEKRYQSLTVFGCLAFF